MKIRNLDRLKRRIRSMPSATKTEIRAALDDGSSEMVDLAKSFVPEKTGALARSIDKTWGEYKPENANVRGVSSGGGGHELSVVIHAGDAEAYYASWVEFGTAPHTNGGKFKGTMNPGAKANPYFFPAYRLLKKRMKSKLSRAMRRAIKKATS
ncbi:HK97-gp10 family putative phage morphogenesis protein [Agrobacterium vitis]|uniref:HK97-gp10 family putative phage morphogenesis protein n=1 Tax=Agrobacterium vitis TaxID=373 RepID=UPI0012E807DA|nr:HK97-gp10 family putative phage morphogenesis protein [Agrobacterium vitis]MUZ65332.1 HK97 gp10 family phage protein [Agrobacterium vitis]